MADSALPQLLAALGQSPDNLALRLVVVRMLLESGDAVRAGEAAAPLQASALSSSVDRRSVAEALRRSGNCWPKLPRTSRSIA